MGYGVVVKTEGGPVPHVPVLLGPTASGKTAASLAVARHWGDMEIVSADSRQIYRGMDIGTAKPTSEERARVRHHLIDILDPDRSYSAGAFAVDARTILSTILAEGGRPLVVGGAGFYIRALFEGLDAPPVDPDLARSFRERAEREGVEVLLRELQDLDPSYAARLTPGDDVRIVRALVCIRQTGVRYSDFQGEGSLAAARFVPRYFGIMPSRSFLYERINLRVLQMVEEGLIEETAALLQRGFRRTDAGLRTIGYAEAAAYLEGEIDRAGMIARIQQGTRRYAKRQITWFRRVEGVRWIDAEREDVEEVLKKATEQM